MVKQPSFQFYPGDWLKDAELRVCSHFARGLLVDLLCIMFEAKHRGRLCRPDGETPWTDEQIVDTSAGGSREDKLAALAELEANGVLKRDSSGILYSARLIRDEEIREERRESGSKGGSKTQANRKQTPEQTEQQKQSSSSSSSSSITGTGPNRRFAETESTASFGNRAAIAAIRIQPLPRGTITNGQALASIPNDIGNFTDLADWWRRHLSSDKPLTGDTALDLLQVLCLATETTRKGRTLKSPVAWFATRLADGRWLDSSTAAKDNLLWINSQIDAGRIMIEKTEAVK